MATPSQQSKDFFLWQALADKHNLSFVSTEYEYGQVLGDYRDHYLTLSYTLGDTKISLFANHSPRSHRRLKNEILKNKALTAANILDHVTPPLVLEKLKGPIAINSGGQTISYEQSGFENNIKYLEFVFDLICDLAATYLLINRIGSQAVPTLVAVVSDPDHKLREFVIPLLEDIAQQTRIKLMGPGQDRLCPSCLVYCGTNIIQLSPFDSITYYGCRACGQSDKFRTWQGRIVAILDSRMVKEQYEKIGTLYVNWLTRRKLFDFDSVRIIEATDEDIERLAVLIGNDTDEVRKPRYSKMRCLVSSKCRLSPNTLRILQRTFGRVTHR